LTLPKPLIALGLLLAAHISAYAGDPLRLTIIYTNDLHGYMLPFDYETCSRAAPGARVSTESRKSTPTMKSATTRKIDGVRVGFLGLTSARSQAYEQVAGWTIGDPIEAARRWVPIARKECDILVAVTHIGQDQDRELASKVDGIDAIIGGDSHTFLPGIVLARNPRGIDIPIVQDGAYGVCLGRMDLTIEGEAGSRRIASAKAELVAVDRSVKEDPAVAKIIRERIEGVGAE